MYNFVDYYSVVIVSKVRNVTQIPIFCGHNSKCDCKMLKVVVINRNFAVKLWTFETNGAASIMLELGMLSVFF